MRALRRTFLGATPTEEAVVPVSQATDGKTVASRVASPQYTQVSRLLAVLSRWADSRRWQSPNEPASDAGGQCRLHGAKPRVTCV